MAIRLVRPTSAGSANAPGHLLAAISRRFCAQSETSSQVYLVQLKLRRGMDPDNFQELERWYHRVMSGGKNSGIGSDKDPRILSSYKHVLTGFAARLSRDEVLALRNHDDFLLATPSKTTDRCDPPGYIPPPSQRVGVGITREDLEKLRSSKDLEKLLGMGITREDLEILRSHKDYKKLLEGVGEFDGCLHGRMPMAREDVIRKS